MGKANQIAFGIVDPETQEVIFKITHGGTVVLEGRTIAVSAKLAEAIACMMTEMTKEGTPSE